ncbi:MAG: hypothetical protein ACI957_005270 [Verrucomicrobiales bacterium]|jgi:hypothetical protein
MEPHFRLHYFESSGDLEQSQPDLGEGHPLPLRSFQHSVPEGMQDRVGHRVQKPLELVGRRFLTGARIAAQPKLAFLDEQFGFAASTVNDGVIEKEWGKKNGGKNYLQKHDKPLRFQHFTETSKETLASFASVALQRFAEVPQGVCVRHGISWT